MHTLGRYILERRIAAGGMAEVFLARQTGAYGFEKRIALKLLKPEIASDEEHARMFVREALVAAEFRHTNLAQVYEVGEENGRLFIAMELVRGISAAMMLRRLAEKGGGIALNAAVRIALDALDGLTHAHEARDANDQLLNLVHRDISPQNIMVAMDGTTKVVDFGIARAESMFGRTVAPRIKGKFSYMAPEQWQPTHKLDARADLFALAIVLYEMTTGGAKLFRAESPKEGFKAAVLDPIAPPSSRIKGYPAGLEAVVMKGLERDPEKRWQSAREMRTALLEFARTERWALANAVVSEVVRAAVGTDDVESLWEPVASAPTGVSDEAPTTVERADVLGVSAGRSEGQGTVAMPLLSAREKEQAPRWLWSSALAGFAAGAMLSSALVYALLR